MSLKAITGINFDADHQLDDLYELLDKGLEEIELQVCDGLFGSVRRNTFGSSMQQLRSVVSRIEEKFDVGTSDA